MPTYHEHYLSIKEAFYKSVVNGGHSFHDIDGSGHLSYKFEFDNDKEKYQFLGKYWILKDLEKVLACDETYIFHFKKTYTYECCCFPIQTFIKLSWTLKHPPRYGK